MTTRHDATKFCHNELDHCLDRLRASLSTHLDMLHEHGLGQDSEIILVEWNPCTGNNITAQHCDRSERGGRGFLPLDKAVERLVIPSFVKTPIRVLRVSAEVHNDDVYNPSHKDIMEYIGQNVGARRARGKFLLFTNPDNIFPVRLGKFLGKRHLHLDTVYTTFKANVWLDVPVSSRGSISPKSMRNFAQLRFRDSQNASRDRTRFRHALCPQEVDEGYGESLGGDVLDEDDEPFFASGRADLAHLNTHAVGDFFLASRKIVRTVRGYPECGANKHVDALIVAAAAAHGFGNLVLGQGCEFLHQKHQCLNSCLPEDDVRFQNPAMIDAMAQMLDMGPLANIRPAHVTPGNNQSRIEDTLLLARWNTADWGLARHAIPETRLWSTCSASCVLEVVEAESESESKRENVEEKKFVVTSGGNSAKSASY